MLGGLSAPGLLAVGHRKGCYVILAAVCILGQWLWTFKWFRVGQVGVGGGGGQSLLGQAGAVLAVLASDAALPCPWLGCGLAALAVGTARPGWVGWCYLWVLHRVGWAGAGAHWTVVPHMLSQAGAVVCCLGGLHRLLFGGWVAQFLGQAGAVLHLGDWA